MSEPMSAERLAEIREDVETSAWGTGAVSDDQGSDWETGTEQAEDAGGRA